MRAGGRALLALRNADKEAEQVEEKNEQRRKEEIEKTKQRIQGKRAKARQMVELTAS